MEQPALERRLGTADAVVIGLGSMIGAGVFSAFGPAARAAGAGLLIGLVLAASAAVHPRHRVPHHAEIALGAVVCVLVATVDLRGVIGFSSFGVLIYYAIANAAAYTLPGAGRWARVRDVCGVAGCLLLVATLPWQSAVAGLGMFAIGVVGRALRLRLRG